MRFTPVGDFSLSYFFQKLRCTDRKIEMRSYREMLLRSENPNGMCAKLRTVVASNNRVHSTRSLCYCSRHIHMVLFFAHIPLLVTAHSAQRQRRGCNKTMKNCVVAKNVESCVCLCIKFSQELCIWSSYILCHLDQINIKITMLFSKTNVLTLSKSTIN